MNLGTLGHNSGNFSYCIHCIISQPQQNRAAAEVSNNWMQISVIKSAHEWEVSCLFCIFLLRVIDFHMGGFLQTL